MDPIEALLQSSLMRALDDRQLNSLASVARRRRFDPGEHLIREGTAGALAMFVVLEGKVGVKKGEQLIAEFGPGAHVGEVAVLGPEDQRRTADVVAIEPTTVLQLTKWDIFPVLKTNPDAALAVISDLAKRLSDATGRMAAD
ncbi:MAG: cyclic nucleotide-binding domain-containing protein [Acidimicrobiia bacterium]|jgi:CRP-like cAMP-binding protein